MIAMDKVHSIRQLFYEQGKSVSAIAAETGHDRKTISKYLDMTDFNTPEPQKEDGNNICITRVVQNRIRIVNRTVYCIRVDICIIRLVLRVSVRNIPFSIQLYKFIFVSFVFN